MPPAISFLRRVFEVSSESACTATRLMATCLSLQTRYQYKPAATTISPKIASAFWPFLSNGGIAMSTHRHDEGDSVNRGRIGLPELHRQRELVHLLALVGCRVRPLDRHVGKEGRLREVAHESRERLNVDRAADEPDHDLIFRDRRRHRGRLFRDDGNLRGCVARRKSRRL